MDVRELAVRDAYEFVPPAFPDRRGLFVAPYQEPAFVEAVGHRLTVAQTNNSVSRRGTIRGVHFRDTPPGQAKYVYCAHGALLDVVVDLRVGSPTFGQWDVVRLDSTAMRCVYLAEGLGHAFMALEDGTVMTYLCSTGYEPSAEHGITPLDPELNLPWPSDVEPVLSDKDAAAPTLAQALEAGILPRYEDCLAHYERLRKSEG
ncbi:dTDP-4-dehydrorhamnose 3,5-epimerase family protein [Saccharomonospora viridis]|jgi:epimerase EvaD|uniref:dTDP-4-dehydrorhamnose 3,5-epimerase n=1 Tax=Saccharomonospora viridis (strain ATCC 15386 / DSM 43017 / JCM 3036 / CCUG 5913 / NBRC 12207 / NCIMB 9602 / P101) TaxID=471857 RepID=C7MXW1_SACVD|nr:dTDP-4-dehydrorhamnose 3,5-epimerase [Saccharomonospora viridis]ACU98039.1 dTDP-4-dehydrorhamnose 3,5-epimerase [Saccharomonospora viridis DSM 43017]SFP37296.1 dTDP-4-dehydrorhamnose 3,5-epimerase [Saccharomonospora viridis]